MRPPTHRPHRVTSTRRRRAARARRHRGWRTATAVALTAGLLVACDAGGADTMSTSSDAAGGYEAGERPAATTSSSREGPATDEMAATDDGEASGPEMPGPDRNISGEHVVRTADITLEMEDTERALSEVRRVAERVGGTVATADLRRDVPAGDLGGVIVVRVPSDELLGALDGLEELAVDAPVRRIDERDVTSEVVDLRARVTNLTAYETELRALLTEVREGTSDADRLLPVFERAQEVRSEIDRLTAQREALADRVARSTITVTVRPAKGSEPIPATTWAPLQTLERAAATTLGALAAVGDATIWLVVVALPVGLVIAGPPALAVWGWRRRHPRADGGATLAEGDATAAGGGGGTPSSASGAS